MLNRAIFVQPPLERFFFYCFSNANVIESKLFHVDFELPGCSGEVMYDKSVHAVAQASLNQSAADAGGFYSNCTPRAIIINSRSGFNYSGKQKEKTNTLGINQYY